MTLQARNLNRNLATLKSVDENSAVLFVHKPKFNACYW